jgi:hypothetical protein
VAHVADTLCQRLELLDGDTQLAVVDEPCPFIEVLVEEGD